MFVDFIDRLSELLLDSALLLIDFFLGLRFDQWIVLLGAEDGPLGEFVAESLRLLSHILGIVTVGRGPWPDTLTSHLPLLGLSEFSTVLFI